MTKKFKILEKFASPEILVKFPCLANSRGIRDVSSGRYCILSVQLNKKGRDEWTFLKNKTFVW